jgi:hypothetical protein
MKRQRNMLNIAHKIQIAQKIDMDKVPNTMDTTETLYCYSKITSTQNA